MGSIDILYGALWLLGGFIWLRRALVNKARPPYTEEQRRWGAWLSAAGYVMLGVLYLLKAGFSPRH